MKEFSLILFLNEKVFLKMHKKFKQKHLALQLSIILPILQFIGMENFLILYPYSITTPKCLFQKNVGLFLKIIKGGIHLISRFCNWSLSNNYLSTDLIMRSIQDLQSSYFRAQNLMTCCFRDFQAQKQFHKSCNSLQERGQQLFWKFH